jgi:hypothetical protein
MSFYFINPLSLLINKPIIKFHFLFLYLYYLLNIIFIFIFQHIDMVATIYISFICIDVLSHLAKETLSNLISIRLFVVFISINLTQLR